MARNSISGHTLAFPEPAPFLPALSLLVQPLKESNLPSQVDTQRALSSEKSSPKNFSLDERASSALSRPLLWALGLRLERRIPVHQTTRDTTRERPQHSNQKAFGGSKWGLFLS